MIRLDAAMVATTCATRCNMLTEPLQHGKCLSPLKIIISAGCHQLKLSQPWIESIAEPVT